MTLHDLCVRLLPPDDRLLVETLVMEEHGISLVLSATAPTAICPGCVHPACRVQGAQVTSMDAASGVDTAWTNRCGSRSGQDQRDAVFLHHQGFHQEAVIGREQAHAQIV